MAIAINGTTGISGVDGSASAPALQGTDSNTGVSFGSDILGFSTGGTERSRFDSNGNLLIGNTSHNNGAFGGNTRGINVAGIQPQILLHETDTDKDAYFGISGSQAWFYTADSIPLKFGTADTERMRIDSSGNVGIGTTSPDKKLHVDTGSSSANHYIAEFTGTNDSNAASLNFYYFGCGSDTNRTGLYWEHQNVGNARMWMDDSLNLRQSSSTPTANNSGTAFSYAGGSDYRLKKNVVNYTNAITELNQLKPYKFNYIETDRIIVDKPNVLVSGFYAHEAGAVVPNSLIGTKDEVDFNGDPIYQSLKYEKFVPLLTAALQEAVAKIETLETKVAALEAG